MKAAKNIVILFLLIGISYNNQAQDIEKFKEISLKTEAYYKSTEEYSISVTYQFFEEKATVALETLQGLIEKKGLNYYSKIGSTEFIYIGNNFLKINHSQKAVLYNKMQNKNIATPVEVSSLIGYFEDVIVSNNKGRYICTITFKKLNTIPYKKMILYINSKTFAIEKQELYMLTNKNYPWQGVREKTMAGKVIVTLTPQNNMSSKKDVFNLSNYIITGKEVKLSTKLSSYKLINTNK